VNCILQDRHGFLWLGTQDGLNRYDGYHFRVFKHDAREPGSLANNTVWALFEDSDGVLWVGRTEAVSTAGTRRGRRSSTTRTMRRTPRA
jgi:ligand-binding sensor domain-containing protein